MQEDLAALKKGQAPAGFQIEKQSEKEIKLTEPAVPKPTLRPQTSSHVELGRLEKSKPLPGTGMSSLPSLKLPGQPVSVPPLPPIPSLSKPSLGIPATAGPLNSLSNFGSKKLLLGGGIGLVVIVAVAAFMFLRTPPEPETTLSPTPSKTATPTPPATPFIEGVFTPYSSVNLSVGPDVFGQLLLSTDQAVLASGQPGLYKIVNPQTGQHYSFENFISSALVTVPEEIKTFFGQNSVYIYLSLMQKPALDYSYGFIVKLEDDLNISQALNLWETNLSTNLKDLFDLDITKAASIDFLDNTYQGNAIRYINFPGPLKTIDYAVVTAPNGDKYLVFANSQEHIYAIIDNLR